MSLFHNQVDMVFHRSWLPREDEDYYVLMLKLLSLPTLIAVLVGAELDNQSGAD
jgi:hypothetical protein